MVRLRLNHCILTFIACVISHCGNALLISLTSAPVTSVHSTFSTVAALIIVPVLCAWCVQWSLAEQFLQARDGGAGERVTGGLTVVETTSGIEMKRGEVLPVAEGGRVGHIPEGHVRLTARGRHWCA